MTCETENACTEEGSFPGLSCTSEPSLAAHAACPGAAAVDLGPACGRQEQGGEGAENTTERNIYIVELCTGKDSRIGNIAEASTARSQKKKTCAASVVLRWPRRR